MKKINILQAMDGKALFGRWFARGMFRDSWSTWRVYLAALFGLPVDSAAMKVYQQHTGRTDLPAQQCSESWIIAGRRSGKSLISALIAVYLAAFKDYTSCLAPGEVATIMVIASDRQQSRVVLSYVNGFFDAVPILSQLVANRTKEGIELSNRVRIEVHTASFRAVRGYSIACAILDECAFFPSGDSADSDEELVNALRPALATIPGSLLLGISSPYAKRGILYRAFVENYGKTDAPALVWRAPTASMNPTVPAKIIREAYARDSASAESEYGANFRNDISAFIGREIVEARMIPQRFELPPRAYVNYFGFVDPSGGSSDAMTLAVAHFERGLAVLDLVREKQPPFSPEAVTAEFAEALRHYRVSTVVGDAYGGEWPREQFEKRGILYKLSQRNRSEIYLELLPTLMSAQVELLDNQRLVGQLCSLERKTARSGKDSVDHPPGAHDDLANCVAGVLTTVLDANGIGAGYGLLDYEKSGRAEKDLDAVLLKPTTSTKFELQAPPCPTCQSTCVSPVSNFWRCANCASQWSMDTADQTVLTRASVPAVAGLCPACSSNLWRVIGGAGKRCRQCGHQEGNTLPKNGAPRNGDHRNGQRAGTMQPKGFVAALARLIGGGRR